MFIVRIEKACPRDICGSICSLYKPVRWTLYRRVPVSVRLERLNSLSKRKRAPGLNYLALQLLHVPIYNNGNSLVALTIRFNRNTCSRAWPSDRDRNTFLLLCRLRVVSLGAQSSQRINVHRMFNEYDHLYFPKLHRSKVLTGFSRFHRDHSTACVRTVFSSTPQLSSAISV